MPYRLHPQLTPPPDDVVVWRYMDFAKFVQLLEMKTLWFSRADRFEDPLEGTMTDSEIDEITKKLGDVLRLFDDRQTSSDLGNEKVRKNTFVSCWRMGAAESLAMWDLYGKGSGVVAVKSTIGLLRQQFEAQQQDIFLSEVRYVDWSSSSLVSEHGEKVYGSAPSTFTKATRSMRRP
jgi:hypothetical protein